MDDGCRGKHFAGMKPEQGCSIMVENQIYLTDAECQLLRGMSQLTGKSENQLLQEALDLLWVQVDIERRRALLQEARGMWRDRDDLPALSELRGEMNRN
jgi:hypothetical protein